jgi:hypothetical protein
VGQITLFEHSGGQSLRLGKSEEGGIHVANRKALGKFLKVFVITVIAPVLEKIKIV